MCMQPNITGRQLLLDISLREVVPFIQWTYFFRVWKIQGKYDGIDTLCECSSCQTAWLQNFPDNERDKAKEALKLFRDAQEMLHYFLDSHTLRINTVIGIFPAYSQEDDIIIRHNEQELRLPMLRQQHPSTDGYCYSLADFIAPTDDYIGVFACTVLGADICARQFEEKDDLYHSILVKTLADRLAEAASEWLHFQVRTRYWGYNPDEKLDVDEILKNHYPGIRPAVGYPSLPDQSVIFQLASLIKTDEIGISLTENGAMYPNASVCGLYFSHPKSKYFRIGTIDDQQLSHYATRRNKTLQEIKKWTSQLTVNN